MNNLVSAITAILLFSFFTDANAKLQVCTGEIKSTYVGKNGKLYIRGTWLGEHQAICSVDSTWKGVSPNACKAWFSTSQVAVTTQIPVTIFIEASACDAIPLRDASPSPDYLMINAP